MNTEQEPQKEAVLLLAVYSRNGRLYAKVPEETDLYKLYGFLICYMEVLRDNLEKNLESGERNG